MLPGSGEVDRRFSSCLRSYLPSCPPMSAYGTKLRIYGKQPQMSWVPPSAFHLDFEVAGKITGDVCFTIHSTSVNLEACTDPAMFGKQMMRLFRHDCAGPRPKRFGWVCQRNDEGCGWFWVFPVDVEQYQRFCQVRVSKPLVRCLVGESLDATSLT